MEGMTRPILPSINIFIFVPEFVVLVVPTIPIPMSKSVDVVRANQHANLFRVHGWSGSGYGYAELIFFNQICQRQKSHYQKDRGQRRRDCENL